MKNLFGATFIVLCAVAGYTTAGHAADISKAQKTAEFRLKVAACKAEAGKNNSSEFYRTMAACIDRANVSVEWTKVAEVPAK